MIWKIFVAGLIMIAGLLVDPTLSFPQCGRGWRDHRPYGGYCRGPRWGWYGARKPVKTAEDARKILRSYFEGENMVIGKIMERKWYFEVDIKDKNDNLVDRVIVDKRTGRIRSIY